MIQGISEASQSISYDAMAELQGRLADAILKDPDVDSVSSFIGVDGTNQTQNTGRFLINLKPHDERKLNATAIIRRLRHEVSDVVGVALYLQPVQDLTIDATVSRAPYQFVLEDANPKEFETWVPKLVARLAPGAADRRRRQRPAAAGPGARHRHRPRHRRPLRHHAGDRRQRALRRVRPAHHLDHLHPVEPVSRDPGSRSRRCSVRSTASA